MKQLLPICHVFVLTFLISSCKKEIKNNDDAVTDVAMLAQAVDQGQYPNEYIVLRTSKISDAIDTATAYKITALAAFKDNGQLITPGSLVIQNRNIAPNPNTYRFEYTGNDYLEGKGFAGTNVTLGFSGNASDPAETKTIYVPLNIYVQGLVTPDILNRNRNLDLTWNPDPNNLNHKAYIQIYYYPSLSQINNPGMPSSVNSLIYDTDDDGAFSISSSDLSRFPINSYVGIAIGRGTILRPTPQTRRQVTYFTITDTRSIPLLVQP